MNGPELSPKFHRVIAFGDSYVLNKIPDVVILLCRQPIVCADLAVVAQPELGQTTVKSGGWV